MKKVLKGIRLFLAAVSVVVLLVSGILILPRLFGITPYIVLSGSMEPVVKTGSLAYVKDVDVNELKKGDIISFEMGENTVTHRIYEVTESGYITKGDANDVADLAEVSKDQVKGKMIFSIPQLGYLAAWLSSTTGKIVVLWFVALLIISLFI